MSQWLVIGISGITCGGKTTLAVKLRDYFSNQRYTQLWNTPYLICDIQLISQDDYFLHIDDLRHKWEETLNAINFELITSLDMKQMVSDIKLTTKGRHFAVEPVDKMDVTNEISNNLVSMQDVLCKSQQNIHHNVNQHMNVCKQNQQNTTHIMRVNTQIAAQLREEKINILIIEGFRIFNQPEIIALCNIKFHIHLPYEKCFERRRNRIYHSPDVSGYFEMCVWPHHEQNFMEYRARKDITFLNGEVNKEKLFKFALELILQYLYESIDVASPPPLKLLGIPSCSNGNTTQPNRNKHGTEINI